MMTSDNNIPSLDSVMQEDEQNVKVYTPSDKEIQKDLKKAKVMNKDIMKEFHPEEYKKLEDLKKQKEKEDKAYKELM
jgi:hypothetical protein